MVRMEMTDEHLVKVVVGNLEGRNSLRRPGSDIEEELVAVSELYELTRGGLLGAGVGHPRAASGHTHLVGRQIFRPRVVHVAVTEGAHR